MNKLIKIFFILVITSCNRQGNTSDNVVAKVYDYVLTKEELKANIPKIKDAKDSLKIVQDYIENWSKQKLLYRNALINLDNTEELNNLVEKYKEELYIAYYKNALASKKIDTTILESDIDSFYVKNNKGFKLNEDLIKFKFIQINKESKNKYTTLNLFTSKKKENLLKILEDKESYDDFYFNDSTWVSLKDVYLKKANFPVLNSYDLSRTNRLITKRAEDKGLYYVYIKETAKKGDIAPLEYVRPTIKDILVHKNKIKFFNQMEQILIDDAVKQKKYEVY